MVGFYNGTDFVYMREANLGVEEATPITRESELCSHQAACLQPVVFLGWTDEITNSFDNEVPSVIVYIYVAS